MEKFWNGTPWTIVPSVGGQGEAAELERLTFSSHEVGNTRAELVPGSGVLAVLVVEEVARVVLHPQEAALAIPSEQFAGTPADAADSVGLAVGADSANVVRLTETAAAAFLPLFGETFRDPGGQRRTGGR